VKKVFLKHILALNLVTEKIHRNPNGTVHINLLGFQPSTPYFKY